MKFSLHSDWAACLVFSFSRASSCAGLRPQFTPAHLLQDGKLSKFSAGKPIFSIVKQKIKWIEANLKETQLTHIKKGQEAKIIVDAYPSLTWRSKVTSIGAATGSEFSILPPQNASGNWIKVVQRIPIRLKIEKEKTFPNLRPGMSVKVIIDTKQRRSALQLALKAWASAKENY